MSVASRMGHPGHWRWVERAASERVGKSHALSDVVIAVVAAVAAAVLLGLALGWALSHLVLMLLGVAGG